MRAIRTSCAKMPDSKVFEDAGDADSGNTNPVISCVLPGGEKATASHNLFSFSAGGR